MREGRSRILIASGGNEPVADSGANGHSVFANAMLRGLNGIESTEFTAAELFNRFILEQVAGRASQTPEYGVIRNSGHDSGDFVFSKGNAIANNTAEPARPPTQPPRQEHVEPEIYTEMVKGIAIEMVRLPVGKFLMGSLDNEAGRESDEGPQHEVTITKSFYMGKYEVTQGQWRAVASLPKEKIELQAEPSRFIGDNLPVESVSWEEVEEFCKRLSRATGKRYRLPIEAEWEYGCRAGMRGAYAGNLDEMGWYGNNSGRKTHPVGEKQANGFGLYDMHGNVWEWCRDWYGKDYYSQSPRVNPEGPSTGAERVRRGGGWDSGAAYCRSAGRGRITPDFRFNNLGFRLVRSYN
jgi:formylglycine-generating enzyme required for sulfatase activity